MKVGDMNVNTFKVIFYVVLIIIIVLIFIDLPKGDTNANSLNGLEPNVRMFYDGDKYTVEKPNYNFPAPKELKSLGSKLTCDVLSEMFNQKIKSDVKISGRGEGVTVDCYDSIRMLSVDYKPESYYSYDGVDSSNTDQYEMYDRMYLNEVKKEQLANMKIKYIEVPFTVDMCEKKGDEVVCHDRLAPKVRKEKIRNYLQKKIFG